MQVKKMKTPDKISKIAIAGAGGIGGFVARNLYNYGAIRDQFPFNKWTWTVFDDDAVDTGNTLHQDFGAEDIGKLKVDIMAERYGMTPMNRFMETADFKDFDVVFSCVDSMTFRKALYEYGYDHPDLVWIDGRCSSRNIGLYHSGLPRKMIEKDVSDNKERAGCLRKVDKENKHSHLTPQIIACMMVQTFLNYLRKDLQEEKILLMI